MVGFSRRSERMGSPSDMSRIARVMVVMSDRRRKEVTAP